MDISHLRLGDEPPCNAAQEFCRDMPDIETAWDQCVDPFWLTWYLVAVGEPASNLREFAQMVHGNCDRILCGCRWSAWDASDLQYFPAEWATDKAMGEDARALACAVPLPAELHASLEIKYDMAACDLIRARWPVPPPLPPVKEP